MPLGHLPASGLFLLLLFPVTESLDPDDQTFVNCITSCNLYKKQQFLWYLWGIQLCLVHTGSVLWCNSKWSHSPF